MQYGSDEFNKTLMAIIRDEYRHPYYDKAVELAKSMSVHVYGDKPDDLLNRVRPGEDDAIKQYRLDNYEPTTKAACGKAIKITSKIFNPNISSIIFKDSEGSKRLKTYTMEYYPVYNSIVVFNKDVTLKKMIADANAVMVVKPLRKPLNDSERVKPTVVIYGSENVYYWDDEHFLILISIEETKDKGKIFTFEYIDYNQILRFTAESPKEFELTIEELPDESYQHAFIDANGEPQIPAWRLGGNSIALPDGGVLFESFFADAQAHWNLSIIHESDVLGAFTKHMHPQRIVIGEECTNQKVIDGIRWRCQNGYLIDGRGNLELCDMCGGSGKVSSSPYEDNIINKEKLEAFQNNIEPVSYVRVPTDATKLLADRADSMVQKGNAAINMDIEDKVGENQSGIAKVYDRSAQHDTMFDIGSRMFDVIMNNQFYFINKFMNGTFDRSRGATTDDNLPQVNKPTSFNIESVSELIAGYKDGQDAKLDRNVLKAKALDIINRDMETNPERKKYFSNVINLDPLFGMVQDELDANRLSGTVYKTDVVIHNNIMPFVNRAISENKNFLDQPDSKKLDTLKKYAEELLKAEKPQVIALPDMQPNMQQAS